MQHFELWLYLQFDIIFSIHPFPNYGINVPLTQSRLVSQLSSLTQTSFQLTLRGNSKKISQFRRELSEHLTSNSVTVGIAEKEDNLLPGDKVQVVSETTYSNYSRTVENIFTGSFNPIIFDYVLNHCKQKTLMGCNNSLPEGTFRFKIEPLIRI